MAKKRGEGRRGAADVAAAAAGKGGTGEDGDVLNDASNKRLTRAAVAAKERGKQQQDAAARNKNNNSKSGDDETMEEVPPAAAAVRPRRSSRLRGKASSSVGTVAAAAEGGDSKKRGRVHAAEASLATRCNKRPKKAATKSATAKASSDYDALVDDDESKSHQQKKKSAGARGRGAKKAAAPAAAARPRRGNRTTGDEEAMTTTKDPSSNKKKNTPPQPVTRSHPRTRRSRDDYDDDGYDGGSDGQELQPAMLLPPHDPYNHGLALAHLDPDKFTRGMATVDVLNRGNVLEAPEYVADIYQRLYHAEAHYLVRPYLPRSTVTIEMRSIVVNWLEEVHRKFHLVPETLYLAVHIMDRFLSKAQVPRRRLQLVAMTSLLIASKYEEIYPPEVRDCVYMSDRAYTRQDVIDTEAEILAKLQFMISAPTAYPFLTRFLSITGATSTMQYAANYYLERVLLEHEILRYRPSLVAAAAVCLAINHEGLRDYDDAVGQKPNIPAAFLQYTGFTAEEIVEAATLVAEKVREEIATVAHGSLNEAKHKYGSPRYEYVSDFRPPTVESLSSGRDVQEA